MLDAYDSGADVSAWAEGVEGQVAISRVAPQTVLKMHERGLLGEDAAEAASSPSYAARYNMRWHAVPYAVIWAPVFTAVTGSLGALGASAPAIASVACALVVAAADANFRSIAALPCLGIAFFGTLAWGGANVAYVVAMTGVLVWRLLLTLGASPKSLGTGDVLLFACMVTGIIGAGALMTMLVSAIAVLVSTLIAQRVSGRKGPVPLGPLMAVPYIIAWAVV